MDRKGMMDILEKKGHRAYGQVKRGASESNIVITDLHWADITTTTISLTNFCSLSLSCCKFVLCINVRGSHHQMG